jgi:hypothetical protein
VGLLAPWFPGSRGEGVDRRGRSCKTRRGKPRVSTERPARLEVGGRVPPHERTAFGVVLVTQQCLERHVDEGRVSVPRLAIGERELGALDYRVDPVRPVELHGIEIEALEQRELLEKDGSLPPWPRLEHPVAVVVAIRRRLDARPPFAQVIRGEQAAVGPAGRIPGFA